jgi:D-xylose transport system substrate-binding protein
MEILLPVIQSEAVALVAEKQPARRDPADASRIMSGVLSAANGRVDAVVAFDDGIALGALKALKDRKLAGQAAVCGQGATAAACRAIVDGELTLTILKDDDELAAAAVDLAVKLALKEPVPGIVKNRLAVLTGDDGLKGEVPCYLVKGVIIDKNNVYDRIVKAGLQPYDEVYRDLPEKERPPRPKPSP